MTDDQNGAKAFSTFRVLNGDGNVMERDQLFRNMAQLYAYVSDRCDDDQVAQYDDVLCQLAELVESEARAYVAQLLAPLDRAPGAVVVRLANDQIDVARPLLEFSTVLSDDDLIEIVHERSEDHRVAIAGRPTVTERVGTAIVETGGEQSIARLVANDNAEIGTGLLEKLANQADGNTRLADLLRQRKNVDWTQLRTQISSAGGRVINNLSVIEKLPDADTMGKVQAVVYNRMRNAAGFNAKEWKVAWSQVRALNDRRQLDERALSRFARFGYGHHAAAGLTLMLKISPEVFVKWLAMQDYVAYTVALKAMGCNPDLFEALLAVLPWRDLPTDEDLVQVRERFETLSREEAGHIFSFWQAHQFRRRPEGDLSAVAATTA